jgi:ribosomal protein S13
MDIDPMAALEEKEEANEVQKTKDSNLNTWVAITVALLATFTGICKIKDDNICQAMQQAQADKLDHWSFYQARNIREEIDQAALSEMQFSAGANPSPEQAAAIKRYETRVAGQAEKKAELKQQADGDQSTYDALNYRDDQFDLSDAAVALAIALLAVTALTHKRWLFWLAMAPTFCGFLMGIAGLVGLKIHPDALTKLLS